MVHKKRKANTMLGMCKGHGSTRVRKVPEVAPFKARLAGDETEGNCVV